jgi:ParB family chromosome partitioning protein
MDPMNEPFPYQEPQPPFQESQPAPIDAAQDHVEPPHAPEQNPGEQGTFIRRRLGRGLNALLGGGGAVEEAPIAHEDRPDPNHISCELIERNPFQPRREFAQEDLDELAESIRRHGLLQPVLVRPQNGKYQLIAGERRWRAAQQAGLESIPCRVLELSDQAVFEAAIEENLKRKDLGVLEKALAFRDYLSRFGGTIEGLADRLSMSRANVSNHLRMLDLPDEVKTALASERITSGHARALLAIAPADQIALCQLIESSQLSVRQTEDAVRALQQQHGDPNASGATIPFPEAAGKPAKPQLSRHVQSLQKQLEDHLGAKVQIRLTAKEKGKIVIEFSSNDEFERIVKSLRKAA